MSPSTRRHDAGQVAVALAALLALVVVGVVAALDRSAPRSTVTLRRTAVAAHDHPTGTVVGAHDAVLAGQGRARAPGYDQLVVGCCVAPQTAGARFVAGSDGVVTDLVGRAPNAVSIGHYPEYVDLGARTGARTFSMSDEAWNAMSPTEQWVRNQRFLDRAIRQRSEIRLATPVDLARPGSFFERELQYLFKHGYAPSTDGSMLVRGGL